MKEKSKKMLLMVTIISILFSTLATIFSGKTSAKVTNYSETTRNTSVWLVKVAEAAATIINIKDWAKKNAIDINSLKEQDIVSFEKAVYPYNVFCDNQFYVPDSVTLDTWRVQLCNSVNKEKNTPLNNDNPIITSFKQMGLNTENLKLTATVVADGKTYEFDSDKPEYTEEQLTEIFGGDILENNTTITFENGNKSGTVSGQEVNNLKTITINDKNATIVYGDNNEIISDAISFDVSSEKEKHLKATDIKITKDGNELDLFSNSDIKDTIAQLYYNKKINKWVLDYKVPYGMDVDVANFKVVDGNNDTWVLALGQDLNCYLVKDEVFIIGKTDFDTTLEYNAKIDEKEVGGTIENGVYKPNYDKNNIKRDADVTAIIKSTNGDNIATVNGKTLDSTGKANEDGWYYPDVNDKTTIAKLYPFSKYDNSTDNGMVTEKVELGNEEGLKSNQTVSIKWPFRIIDKTYDPKDITQDTEKVTVTITTNLPMDPDKIPNGWTIVPDTDNHKITKTYTRGENINEDVTIYQNKTGDTDNTDVTINWGGQKSPSVLPKTGEGITVLAIIVLLIGITIVFRKKINNKK